MLLQPENVRLAEVPISPLPFFNPDQDMTSVPMVQEYRAAIARADALLILTPEYAHATSGLLKNAIDWASIPAGRSPLRGKPIALAGASRGRSGTMRAQLGLRGSLSALGAVVLPEPEVFVTFAEDKFNQLGELSDTSSRDQIAHLLQALVEWALLLQDQR